MLYLESRFLIYSSVWPDKSANLLLEQPICFAFLKYAPSFNFSAVTPFSKLTIFLILYKKKLSMLVSSLILSMSIPSLMAE